MRAAAFLDSLGVNTHVGSDPYNDPAKLAAMLTYLGITNIRQSSPLDSADLANMEALGRLGARIDLIINGGGPVNLAGAMANVTALAPYLNAVEGVNEAAIYPIQYAGLNGVDAAAALQKDLYAAVRADPALANASVYMFTLGGIDPAAFPSLGDLSAYTDYANIHSYPPHGLRPIFVIHAAIDGGRTDAPSKPVVITETGYYTLPQNAGWGGVPEAVQASYLLGLVLDEAAAGVARTYLYDLIDDGADPQQTNREDHFGLFHNDGTPKLAATALHNLTTILADVRPDNRSFQTDQFGFTAAGVPYDYTGNTLLFQKSDGTHVIAVWNEQQLWDPDTQTATPVQHLPVTVDLHMTYATVLVIDPMLGTAPVQRLTNVATVTLDLTDHPLLIVVPPPISTAPVVRGISPDQGLNATDGITHRASVAVSGTATANSAIQLYDGALSAGTATADGDGAWSVPGVTLLPGNNDITATSTDSLGTTSASSPTFVAHLDMTAPSASSIATSPSAGVARIDSQVDVALQLDESVMVDLTLGTPTLGLSNGSVAAYSSGSGSATLHFTYRVLAGQNASGLATLAGDALQPNAATITDLAGNPLALASANALSAPIGLAIACFVEGTRIATPSGEVAVEDLRIGDLVVTDGHPQLVKWIGFRRYEEALLAEQRWLRPVVIRAGALANGIPCRDLAVSPSHALLVDGLLIPAVALVNGISIARSETRGHLRYLHVELDGHAVILADGAPCETYVATESRRMFDNHTEYLALYGWAREGCGLPVAQRLEEGYRVEAARVRLALRAGPRFDPTQEPGPLLGHVERLVPGLSVEGWAFDSNIPDQPVELEVLLDGRRFATLPANRYRVDLEQAGLGAGRCGFSFTLPQRALNPDRIRIHRVSDGSELDRPASDRLAA